MYMPGSIAGLITSSSFTSFNNPEKDISFILDFRIINLRHKEVKHRSQIHRAITGQNLNSHRDVLGMTYNVLCKLNSLRDT